MRISLMLLTAALLLALDTTADAGSPLSSEDIRLDAAERDWVNVVYHLKRGEKDSAIIHCRYIVRDAPTSRRAKSAARLLERLGADDNVDHDRIAAVAADKPVNEKRAEPLRLTRSRRIGLEGHSLSAFAFNREGSQIVTVGHIIGGGAQPADKNEPRGLRGHITLWNAETDQEIARFPGDFGAPFDVAFSPDGSTIIVGGRTRHAEMEAELSLWDVETHQPKRELLGHTRRVLGVAFSPDGKFVASGSSDRTLRVWDAEVGKELVVLQLPSTPKFPHFSRDGRKLVVGCESGFVKSWDVGTWQERNAIGGSSLGIYGAELSPNGNYVALAGIPFEPDGKSMRLDNGGLVRLFHVSRGLNRATLRLESYPTAVAFSPDGAYLAICGHKSTIWRIESMEEVAFIQRDTSTSMDKIRFSPDGKWIAICEPQGVGLWDGSALNISAKSDD